MDPSTDLKTEYIECQWPLSGVHAYSIIREKSAQPGEDGGCTPNIFYSTVTHKVVVYAPAERADTLTLFLLYLYVYVLYGLKFTDGDALTRISQRILG
jgi:hypothetical protein